MVEIEKAVVGGLPVRSREALALQEMASTQFEVAEHRVVAHQETVDVERRIGIEGDEHDARAFRGGEWDEPVARAVELTEML